MRTVRCAPAPSPGTKQATGVVTEFDASRRRHLQVSTASHLQIDPGREAPGLRAQQQRGTGKLLGRCGAMHWIGRKLNLAPGTLVVATPSVARGGNQPGRNVIDRDARTGELSRQVQRKVVLRAFQCSIYSERRLGPRLIDAADRQDAAPAPTLHARYRRLQELDGRVEVDSGLTVPFFRAHIDECGALLYRRA